jgi:hypothetical protein
VLLVDFKSLIVVAGISYAVVNFGFDGSDGVYHEVAFRARFVNIQFKSLVG